MAETIERKTLNDIAHKKDRDTLGILMARIYELKVQEQEAKKQLPELTKQATLLLQGHDVKGLKYKDKFFTVVDGSNVSYSQTNLAEAMLKHKIKAEVITKILDEARKVTTYTALQMSTPKESE